MIAETKGDLLDFYRRGDVDCMAHCCNLQKTMSAGIALQIKNEFPVAWDAYENYDNDIGLSLGTVSVGWEYNSAIFNLHAQTFYGRNGSRFVDYEAFYKCLEIVKFHMENVGYQVIGFPKFCACALAGGDWRIILPMIEVVFEDKDVLIVEYDQN